MYRRGLNAVLPVFLFAVLTGGVAAQSVSVASYRPYHELPHHGAPVWSPDDREIIFATIYGREQNLQVVPSIGGPHRLLLNDRHWNGAAAFSRDGKQMAFCSDRSGGRHIWTVSTGGSDFRQITKGMFGFEHVPSWSPDGQRLAYAAFTGPQPKIMLVSSVGEGAVRFADGWRPRWSPDGKMIAYTAKDSSAGGQSLWVAFVKGVDGGEPRRLTSSRTADPGWAPSVDWSPDGRRLVTIYQREGHGGLVIINVADDRVEQTFPVDGIAADPAWSHDGKKIAFMLQSTSHPGEIQTLKLDTKRIGRVSEQRHFGAAARIRYKSADGLEIPAYLYEPRGQRLGKPPAIVWVHGGIPPEGEVTDAFSASIQYFVDQGYMVLAPNYRGSGGWGEKIARIQSPDDPVKDLKAAASYLAGRGADARRTAAVGFSFGGFLAMLTAGREPDTFAAVVDFFGLTDLAALYEEVPSLHPAFHALLGGSPAEKSALYRTNSPITYAAQMRPALLILHGEKDTLIAYSHATRMAKALKAANREFEFLSFPKAGHGFEGEDNELAFERAAEFLRKRMATGANGPLSR